MLTALVLTLGTGVGAASADDGLPLADPTSPTGPVDPTPAPSVTPVSFEAALATAPSTVRCADAVGSTTVEPVLLVHGTGMTPTENWSGSYAPLLSSLGRPVCTIALPAHGTGDVTRSVELVARVIGQVADLAGGDIDVLGHSQGAYLPRAALRLHPELATRVDDVIGLAGVYERGSERLTARCEDTCVPALHQLANGSRLLAALGRIALPPGPSYSNIGSGGDLNITPQPLANLQEGSTSALVQDVCPGRQMDGYDHALLAGDAVAAALVVDALENPGPLDAQRVSPDVCVTSWYSGFDRAEFMTYSSNVGPRVDDGVVPAEPPVPCRLLASCTLTARGKLLHGIKAAPIDRRGRAIVTAVSTGSGEIRVRVGSRVAAHTTVRPGRAVRLSVPVSTGRHRVTVLTRPSGDASWVVENGWNARRR